MPAINFIQEGRSNLPPPTALGALMIFTSYNRGVEELGREPSEAAMSADGLATGAQGDGKFVSAAPAEDCGNGEPLPEATTKPASGAMAN
jgi:hypothetical protein